MKIDAFGPPQQPDPKDEKQKASKRSDKPAEKIKPNSDSIELANSSNQPSQAGYTSQIHKHSLADQEVRKDLDELRQKTSSGYYDAADIKNITSEKLIDSKELKDVVDKFHLTSSSKEILAKIPDVRYEKVAKAKGRIAEGFFDNPANFGAIADKIIGHFKV